MDPTCAVHVIWALESRNDLTQTQKNTIGMDALGIFDGLSVADQTTFRQQMVAMHQAQDLYNQSRTIWTNQEGWATKWAPILAKTALTMTAAEVNALEAHRRVLLAFTFSARTYHATLQQLLPTYAQHGLENVFYSQADIDLQATLNVTTTHDANYRLLVNMCSSPDFLGRLTGATAAGGLTKWEDGLDGKRIWVQADQLTRRGKEIWVWLALDARGNVVDVSYDTELGSS